MRGKSVRYASLAAIGIGLMSGTIAMMTIPAAAPAARRAYFFFQNLTYWTLWALLMPVAVFAATAIRSRRWPAALTLAAHAAMAALCALVHLLMLYAINVVITAEFLRRRLGLRDLVNELLTTPRIVWEWELTLYAALAAMAYANALAVHQSELETSLAQARLLALQRQLRPHFLFNTLQAVAALIHAEPDTAERMIDRLGRLLRAAMKDENAPEVTLEYDLGLVRDYLDIQTAQMRDRLTVSFDIDPATLLAAVPVLLIQPLVENAVLHGLQPRAHGGHITISAARRDDRLEVEIVDDGVGLPVQGTASPRVGLTNTESRLRQLYGARQHLIISNAIPSGVLVKVSLPFRAVEVIS